MNLFKFVVDDDPKAIRAALASCAAPPPLTWRGHTPLSLAVALNRKRCVEALLAQPNPVNALAKNSGGWSAYQEAISVGDRDLARLVLCEWRRQLGVWCHGQGRTMVETLSEDLGDFSVDIRWEFSSWIPFLTQLCPTDVCRVRKKGRNLRIDSTLVGYENFTWIRGNISIILSEDRNGPKLVICDHDRRVVQQIYPQDFSLSDNDIEEEISIAMNSPLLAPPELHCEKAKVSRVQQGILIKTGRIDRIGQFSASVWTVENLMYTQKSRHEHLKVHPLPPKCLDEYKTESLAPAAEETQPEPVQTENSAHPLNLWISSEYLAHKNSSESRRTANHLDILKSYRPSLEPIEVQEFGWEDFLDKSIPIEVGRKQDITQTTKSVSATVWMYDAQEESRMNSNTNGDQGLISWIGKQILPGSRTSGVHKTEWKVSNSSNESNFPVDLKTLAPLLELLGMGSNEHMRSLRNFLSCKLPPGHPVKIEMPINMLPLRAAVTLENLNIAPTLDDAEFSIPGRKMGYLSGEIFSAVEHSRFSNSKAFYDKKE
ncbi:hypothetical protein HDU83_002752 [Entophlyctis luteolus]|nr:hypothetical protein HDU83_002752 [Entophlyctis luteolus]KAJ3393714.1 hypothetical protein HDU84_001121 [Entophlyctis sp. JEL0112]